MLDSKGEIPLGELKVAASWIATFTFLIDSKGEIPLGELKEPET